MKKVRRMEVSSKKNQSIDIMQRKEQLENGARPRRTRPRGRELRRKRAKKSPITISTRPVLTAQSKVAALGKKQATNQRKTAEG